MDLPQSAYNLQSLNYTLLCVLRYHLSNALPLSRLYIVHASITLRSLFHRLSKVGKSARAPLAWLVQELRALCSARLCRLARPRISLSRYSSEGPLPWSNARLCRFYKGGTPTKRTKGSQDLLSCIPFVSFLKRAQRYHFPISCTIRQN